MTFEHKVERLRKLYDAFNSRNIDEVLAALTPDVNWPNMLELTTLHGREEVRAYWLKQFEVIEPQVQPRGFEARGEDIEVKVHQRVTVKDTGDTAESEVLHTYTFQDDLVSHMVVTTPEIPVA